MVSLSSILKCASALALIINTPVAAEDVARSRESNRQMGHLVIVGGGLRPDNRAIFEKMVELAGGRERARFVIIPTASISSQGSHEFCRKLSLYGVTSDRAEVLDVMEHNAVAAARDPLNLEKVRQATCVYLAGGDQRRLVRLLAGSDGRETPLLREIRDVFARGGLIAGSSAGASAQSEQMLAVSGLPDLLIDEGLDALDYGVTSNAVERGLLLTRGFGFFTHGIIDQHFFQYRGRLGRLTRATAESGLPFGFGIDENTALISQPTGRLRVLGAGFVTILQPGVGKAQDGPLGYQIRDVTLSLLSDGDEFDPSARKVYVAPQKQPLEPDKLEYNGNFLLNDISAGGEGPFALIKGLADNRRSVQEAVAIKYHGDTSHGYRFRFSKRPTTQAYVGLTELEALYTVTDVRLDISPIANGLKPSHQHVPCDLPDGPQRGALVAVAFRGLLAADGTGRFRPEAPITRGEFAMSLARSAHLTAAPSESLRIADVDVLSMEGDEILRVVAAGLLVTDDHDAFKPADPLSPTDAVSALTKLAHLSIPMVEPALLQEITALEGRRSGEITRADIGVLLSKILKLPK